MEHDPGDYLMHYFAWVMGFAIAHQREFPLGISAPDANHSGVNARATCR